MGGSREPSHKTGMNSPNSFDTGVLVRRLSSYSPLSGADVAALKRADRSPVGYSRQDDIIRPGDAPPLLFIESGWALRYLPMTDGDQQVVQVLLPGDIVDRAAFLPGARTITAVKCATDIRACALCPRAMHEAVSERPNVARALWLGVMLDENRLLEHVARLGRRSSAEALAHLLLELRHLHKRIGAMEGETLTVPLAQPDIGDLLGITPVHVSRTISSLRHAGLIEMDRPTLRFLDVKRMSLFCGFDPAYLEAGPGPA